MHSLRLLLLVPLLSGAVPPDPLSHLPRLQADALGQVLRRRGDHGSAFALVNLASLVVLPADPHAQAHLPVAPQDAPDLLRRALAVCSPRPVGHWRRPRALANAVGRAISGAVGRSLSLGVLCWMLLSSQSGLRPPLARRLRSLLPPWGHWLGGGALAALLLGPSAASVWECHASMGPIFALSPLFLFALELYHKLGALRQLQQPPPGPLVAWKLWSLVSVALGAMAVAMHPALRNQSRDVIRTVLVAPETTFSGEAPEPSKRRDKQVAAWNLCLGGVVGMATGLQSKFADLTWISLGVLAGGLGVGMNIDGGMIFEPLQGLLWLALLYDLGGLQDRIQACCAFYFCFAPGIIAVLLGHQPQPERVGRRLLDRYISVREQRLAKSSTARAQLRADAHFMLALCYLKGVGVQPHAPTAVELLEASEREAPPGKLSGFSRDRKRILAFLLEKGEGGRGQWDRAMALAEEAAHAGDVVAMNLVGGWHLSARNPRPDPRLAAEWWRRAVDEGGSVEAMTNLGALLLRTAHPDDADRRAGNAKHPAVALLRRAMQEGSRHAAAELGRALIMGMGGVERDLVEGEKLLESSMEQGDYVSHVFLGLSRLRGEHGLPQDAQKGAVVLGRGARSFADLLEQVEPREGDMAHPHATPMGAGEVPPQLTPIPGAPEMHPLQQHAGRDCLVLFGICLFSGTGVDQDQTAAAQYLYRAAQLAHLDAYVILGEMHLKGEGVPKCAQAAATLFRHAAIRGSAAGAALLGRCYHTGEGVSADPREAAIYYRKAAEAGRPDAQFLLAEAYNNGDGVTYDHQSAVHWYTAAARQGHKLARRQLSELGYDPEGADPDVDD